MGKQYVFYSHELDQLFVLCDKDDLIIKPLCRFFYENKNTSLAFIGYL